MSVAGTQQDLATLTVKQATELLRCKDASPVDFVQACLKRIDRYNPAVNAFITILEIRLWQPPAELEVLVQASR